MATRVPVHQCLGPASIVAMDPLHHGLGIAACFLPDSRGAFAFGDFVEPHEAFSATRMTRFQGLLPQYLKGLMPTLGIDLQHGSSHSIGLGTQPSLEN